MVILTGHLVVEGSVVGVQVLHAVIMVVVMVEATEVVVERPQVVVLPEDAVVEILMVDTKSVGHRVVHMAALP